MADKIMGDKLKVGQTIKAHGRILEITWLEDEGPDGSPWSIDAEVRETNGTVRPQTFFADSEYELRTKAGRPRKRMVKVAADDIRLVLDAGVGPGAGEAIDRLREAIKI